MLIYSIFPIIFIIYESQILIDTVSVIHIYIIRYIPYSEFYPWYLMTAFDF